MFCLQYTSWSDFQRPHYIGILVDVVATEGRNEIVRVREKYLPLSHDEKLVLLEHIMLVLQNFNLAMSYFFSLETHAEMESFNIFMQCILSESLEPGFLKIIQSQEGSWFF